MLAYGEKPFWVMISEFGLVFFLELKTGLQEGVFDFNSSVTWTALFEPSV